MSAPPADLFVVNLSSLGAVRGARVDEVVRFLAIPYAKHERFCAPQPPDPWGEAARDNPLVLPCCPQPPSTLSHPLRTFAGHRLEPSEVECLVLNVFTPHSALADEDGPLRPVIFYIHGGSGKFGSCHMVDNASGQALAAQHGVVHVAANYRLGALGWLAHEALLDEDAHAGGMGCGNFGLLDLVSALEWVQQHVRAFGGDPQNVTIWGTSTGSQLVCTLLTCPLARGLFSKAVMQSCADLANVRELRRRHDVWLGKTACEWGAMLAAHLGCASASPREELAKLRALPVEAFIDASNDLESTDCYEPAVHRLRQHGADGEDEGSGGGEDMAWVRGGTGGDAASASAGKRPRTGNAGNAGSAGRANESHSISPKPLPSAQALAMGRALETVPVMLGLTSADGLGKVELEWTMFEEVHSLEEYSSLLGAHFGADRREAALAVFGARTPEEVASPLEN